MRTAVERSARPAAVFVKRPATPEDVDRLARERALLGQLHHPGLVELVPDSERGNGDGDDDVVLSLRVVDGVDLRELTLAPQEVAGLGAAVATIVADLHDLGLAHGSCDASHILIDREGRPVLCSLGAATSASADARREDVQALAEALLGSLAGDDRGLRKRLDRCRNHPPAARALARQLATSVHGARLPDPSRNQPREHCLDGSAARRAADSCGDDEPGEPVAGAQPATWRRMPWYGVRRRTAVAVTAPIVCAALVFIVLMHSGSSDGCPVTDRGCRPVRHTGGVVFANGGRWAVGVPGDVVVVGRWRCGGALPALLRPNTGQVWLFDHWAAASQPVTGRLVDTVTGANSLRVIPRADGCDGLEAIGAHRSVALPTGGPG